MGSASKVCSVIFRVSELISAAIVTGIVGNYLYNLSDANAHAGSRIIYTEVLAGLSILLSILFMPPLKYSFYGFILDFAFFIMWMVAFGLLCNLTVGHGCNSYWYWHNWGYYWGGFWRTVPLAAVTPTLVGTRGCSKWSTTLAFSFIGGWSWLMSGILGVYVVARDRGDRTASTAGMVGHEKDTTNRATDGATTGYTNGATNGETAPTSSSAV